MTNFAQMIDFYEAGYKMFLIMVLSFVNCDTVWTETQMKGAQNLSIRIVTIKGCASWSIFILGNSSFSVWKADTLLYSL